MGFVKQTFANFGKNQCSMQAAALSFYTVFALPPILFLLLTILTIGMSIKYESEEAEERAVEVLKSQTAQMVGNASASEAIATILENNQKTGGKWWKTLISLAGILAGATGVLAALQTALNQVWQVQRDPDKSRLKNTVIKRILSFGMILSLGFLLLVSLIVSTILAAIGDRVASLVGFSGTIANLVDFGVQAVVVLLIFAAIFKFMPDVNVPWRDVFVGATVTTLLFLVGRFAMQFYFSFSAPGAQLGSAAASLAVLLMWIYYTAMIVLLGAEVTHVYAVKYGKGVRPERGAVRVVQQIRR